MLIFSTCIIVFYHFVRSGFQSGMSSCETPSPQTNERRDPSKIYERMLPSYPSKDQNVSRYKCGSAILRVHQKVQWRFFLYRNTSTPTSIKENIPNHIMSILETRELSTMNRVFPKGIQTCLATNWAYLVNWEYVNYEAVTKDSSVLTGDICWPRPSIGIVSRKSWAWGARRHSKTTFCLTVISNLTSISWTILLKRTHAKTFWDLGGAVSLLVKPLQSNPGIVSWRRVPNYPQIIHFLWRKYC